MRPAWPRAPRRNGLRRTTLVRASDRPTLVLLAHPQCDCTRATLGELAEVLARAPRAAEDVRAVPAPGGFRRRLGADSALANRKEPSGRHRAARRRWRGGAAVRRGNIRPDAPLRRARSADVQRRDHRLARPRRRQRRPRLARRAAQSRPGRSSRHERLRLLRCSRTEADRDTPNRAAPTSSSASTSGTFTSAPTGCSPG